MVNIMTVARIIHENNRILQKHNGEEVGPDWYEAPQHQIDSTVQGIRLAAEGATPEALHESWMEEKLKNGWHYGEVKSEEDLTHPCLVPYAELPEGQRLKDEIFQSTVDTFVLLELLELDG